MVPKGNRYHQLLLLLLLLLTSFSSLDKRVGNTIVVVHAHDTTMNTTIQTSYTDGGLEEIHDCFVPIQYDPQIYESTYTIGVLAHRGIKAAYKEFNATFNAYLTATAGKRFQNPIRFQMKALNYTEIFTFSEQKLIDFIYVNPSGK